MKLTIEIPNETVEKIVRGIMDNHPEAGMTLRCHGWDYKKMEFDFADSEDGKEYAIDRAKLMATFPLIFTDKWPKGCKKPPLSGEWDTWDNWLCNCDATEFDAFAQLACLGEVIYG